tara:strand:- start:155 stop:400 length:246 start_codon:yes stop_codon:yes gene_type:complete
MTKLYIIGVTILLTAIVANSIAGYINLNSWYNFSNLIIEKGSFLKALKEQSLISILWLFFIYPLVLGIGCLIAEKLFNIFS